MQAAKIKSTRLTGTGDVKALGGPARIYKVLIMNNGTAGTAGSVEIRDAAAAAGDGGTLRLDIRFGSLDEDTAAAARDIDFNDHGLYMPDGIHVVLNTVTNVIVWVFWEG